MGGGASNASKEALKHAESFNQCYFLQQELGSGAFSVVKLALNKKTHQKVAVKIVTKNKLTEEDLASLTTEIELLNSLDHPHVIKLFEVFEENGEFYIVTELVEGGELFDRIVSKSHYNENEARNLVRIFLETMAYMHGSNVVHRDLKPENLLLTSMDDDANLKIADFGFAKRVTELLPNETACGTPGYVAPEILRGDPYGAEVDIWSMGVIVYVLLAGYPPFYDEDQKRLFRKIKEGKYYFHEEYWKDVSPEATDLIRKMLCVNQAERWTAKQLLQHPWITMGEETLKGKDLTGTITQMKKFNARRRLKGAIAAVTLANKLKHLNMPKKSDKEVDNSEGDIHEDPGNSLPEHVTGPVVDSEGKVIA
eukprot:TRINITY_DN65963_c5_g7_i1.p1 TRINITY_DN65963_c5_g7~~TRINITY_DN65963_c5_g7_i1.p1  ORF type:complete len:367 (+),score=5.44 TRINITY_DN65963_c5_g7_i1:173-1273(+)